MRSDKRQPNVDPKPMIVEGGSRCQVSWSGDCSFKQSKLATFPHSCRLGLDHAKSPNTRHLCWCGISRMHKAVIDV